jgi:hypothetical protein
MGSGSPLDTELAQFTVARILSDPDSGGIGAAGATMSLIYVVGLIVTPFAGSETKGKPLPA